MKALLNQIFNPVNSLTSNISAGDVFETKGSISGQQKVYSEAFGWIDINQSL